MKTPKNSPVIHRTFFTQKVAFPTKPSPAFRKALVDAGWRFNGLHWWRNVNETTTLTAKQVDTLLLPISADAGEVSNTN